MYFGLKNKALGDLTVSKEVYGINPLVILKHELENYKKRDVIVSENIMEQMH